MSSTRVVAVTPVHNRRDLTLQCLRSLFASDLAGIDLHVLVVDDGSTDGTAEAIRAEFGDTVTVVRGDGSLFYSGGMNRGMAPALALDPDYVLGFNDDSVFPPDCIQHLVRCAKRYPGSIVGPLLLDWDRPQNIFQVAPEFEVAYGGWRHWSRQRIDTVPEAPFTVHSIAGNCVLFPQAALEQNYRMHAGRVKHYGDTELTVRLRRSGWTLMIEPAARMLCQPNTPPPLLRQMRLPELFRHLFLSDATPHSLRHRFWHTYLTAPSKAAGILAFAVFLCRLTGRAVGLRGQWPASGDELPLRARQAPPPLPRRESSAKPVIRYIWRYQEFGGVQIYLLQAAKMAQRFGFEARALIPAASAHHTVKLLEEHGIAIDFFDGVADVTPYQSMWKRVRRRLDHRRVNRSLIARLTEITRRDPRPAVLHADLACWSERRVAQGLLSIRPMVCTVYTPLARPGAWRRFQWRRSLRTLLSNQRFVLTSQTVSTRRSLATCLSPADLDCVRVAPGILDAGEVERLMRSAPPRMELERILELPPCGVRIGVVGQLIPRKGYLVLLEALELLPAMGIDAHVVWFCAGAHAQDRDAVLLRGGDRFHVRDGSAFNLGVRDVLPALRTVTDVFVLPSLEEGFPLALAEAMGMAMPCISTRVGAIPDVVRDGRNGVLIEPGNARQLAEAVKRLANDSRLRERLGGAARATALDVFDLDVAALSTIEAYQRLVEAQA